MATVINPATRDRMFGPPVGSEDDPTLVIGVPLLSVAEWGTIMDALTARDEDRKAAHLATKLRRSFGHATAQQVWVSGGPGDDDAGGDL